MTVQEYRDRLFMALAAFDPGEVENVIDYYTELIEDAEDPQAQMENLGTPEQLATKIIMENGWVQPQPENEGYQQYNGAFPPPPQSRFRGWTADRIIALVLALPLWVSVYSIIASLFIVIASVYLAIIASSALGFYGAASYVNTFMPFAAEMLCIGLMMAGLSILLFRPAIALFRGVAGLVADYSFFLFAPGRKRIKRNRERKPLHIIPLIIGAVLLVGGIAGSFAAQHANDKSIDAYVQKMDLSDFEDPLDGSFDSISFSIQTGSMTIIPSTDGKTKLVCENVNRDSLKITNNDRLKINYTMPKNKSGFTPLNIKFGSMNSFSEKTTAKFTLYLPQDKIKKLKLNSDLGDINVTGVKLSDLNVDCSCGEINLGGCTSDKLTINNDLGETCIENCEFKNADITASCGEVNLTSTDCTQKLTLEESLGDVTLADCKVGKLSINNSCGDINVTSTSFTQDSDISSDIGDIDLDLIGNSYGFKINNDIGDAEINGAETNYLEGSIMMTISNNTGDVEISFQ